MMSVTQESVKSAFYMQIPGVCRPRENFLIFFLINCHFGGHFALILILFYIFDMSYVYSTRFQRHS